MPVTTDDKQQSKSTTLPVSQLTIKKTLSLTSSQCKRPLTDKLSSGNFSSVFKLKVPRHSQDRESDVLFKSYCQSNAREIGNFQQGHRKQRKIQESVGATKSGSYKRQIMNRQQPHATLESEREKLETEEDKLGNCHNDPDHNVDTVWYKGLWWALKKQAKKIANSNADADSSSDEFVSFDSHDTRRPSVSTGNNCEKLVSNENLAIRSSKGVQVNHESQKRDKRDKKEPSVQASIILDKNWMYTHPLTPAVSSYHSIPNQGREVTKLRPEQILSLLLNNSINVQPEEVSQNFINNWKSMHSEDFKLLAYSTTSSEEIKKLLEINVQPEEVSQNFINNWKSMHSENYRDYRMQDRFADIAQKQIKWKGDVINLNNRDYRMQDRFADIAQKQTKLKRDVTNLNNWYYAMQCMKYTDFAQNENNLKFVITHLNNIDCDMKDSCADVTQKLTKLKRDVTNLINVQPEEVRRKFFNRSKSKHSKVKLLPDITTSSEKKGEKLVENSKTEERSNTQVNEKENKDVEKQEVAENLPKHGDNVVSSQNLDRPTTQDQRQDERRESTEASEGSTNRPIHPVDRHTTYNSEEDNRIVMRDSMIQIPSSEGNTDISSDESWSTVESALIRLYRNVIRNETSRMKSSLGMVRFEAEHLFGLERSRIFFDLLDEELFQFESAGAISEFVANMAESTVRQHVISFFEHANNTMSRLMTLLLRCTDSKILQQMPIQNFTSLMKSVIKSSLKAQTKGREKVSLEGNIYTMVDQKDFERALGEEIPEDVLNRLRSEDEMVVQSFVDTRQERHQPSDRKEDRPIQCIYFPSDCRLYIYVPTLNGSYWHGSDMRRAKRIRRHSR